MNVRRGRRLDPDQLYGWPFHSDISHRYFQESTGLNGSGHALCMRAAPEEITAPGRRALVGQKRSVDAKVQIVENCRTCQSVAGHLN